MNRKQTDFILNDHDVQDNGINDFRHYFGRVIRNLRYARKLSAEKIESLYGLNAQNIYGYEQGKCIPKKNNLKILCEALRIDPNVLVAAIRKFHANNIPVEQCVSNILSGTEIQMPSIKKDESDLDDLLIRTLQINLKNLSEPEKIILLRHIVNFTTEKVKKEYFHV